MPDLPADADKRPQNAGQVQVTNENAGPLAVKCLSMIYARLGYIIKILEEGKVGG